MSKTHSQQGKDQTLIAVGVSVFILVILIINAAVTVPNLIRIFSPVADMDGKNPVDVETVNRALEAVGERAQ